MNRAVLLVVLCASSTAARATPLDGTWEGPMGAVSFRLEGSTVRGVLVEPRAGIPWKSGTPIVKGSMLGDTLAVQVRVPLGGCRAAEAWAAGMLLVAMNGNLLTGAVHVPEKGCRADLLGKNGGLAIRHVPDELVREAIADLRAERGAAVEAAPPPERPRRAPPALPATASADEVGDRGVEDAAATLVPLGRDEKRTAGDEGLKALRRGKARTVMQEAAAFLQEGRFEQAREKFLEAIRVDPTVPEAYNGLGVSYYGRQQPEEARRWYRRALAVDPDFGDAYYNLACLDALAGRKGAAFRLLELAVKNGYTTDESLEKDPDLSSLRTDRRFAKLRKKGARK